MVILVRFLLKHHHIHTHKHAKNVIEVVATYCQAHGTCDVDHSFRKGYPLG
jgi:hypothetical protein